MTENKKNAKATIATVFFMRSVSFAISHKIQ